MLGNCIRLGNGMTLHWHTLHRALWNWLANTGNSSKVDWPGWEDNGGNVPGDILCDCFACHKASHDGAHCKCNECPLEWPLNLDDEPRCIGRGLFDEWEDAENMYERQHAAEQIRDLPVKEQKHECF